MKEVNVEKKDIFLYRAFLNAENKTKLEELARSIKGKKIAFVNSTAFGGGVAELFRSIVPLARSMGVDLRWFVMDGDSRFFGITKRLHNMLQGKEGTLSDGDIDYYLEVNRKNAERFNEEFDIVVIHDPQPMAMPFYVKTKIGRFVWRCHIDTSFPNPQAKELVRRFLPLYDETIFSMDSFAKGIGAESHRIIYPSIDPLSPKNMEMGREEIMAIVRRFGVDPRRPMIVQISRFDPWKDPLGVIDVYRTLKRKYRDIQLVLIGSMATDDPEGWQFYQKTLRHAGEDRDLFILSNLDGVGNREVNAFQRAATIVLQKSIKEGFGLTVSEALWKKRAVIGGKVGGITIQIQHGRNGYLVNSNEECIKALDELLSNDTKRKAFGMTGYETVSRKFLITRHINDYFSLFGEIKKA